MGIFMKRHLLIAVVLVAGCDRAEMTPQGQLAAVQQAEKSAETRRPLADTSLVDIVRQALLSESSLDARKIDVENKDGNVALHGTVESPEQREKVERIVMSVGGVRSVTNNLAISES
jgi:osmotically-inducible protein OsmY